MAADVAAVAVASASILVCAAVAAGAAAAADALAIAAAAIASGAVALPATGGAAATPVKAMVTGIATATGVGTVRTAPACCAASARSVEELAADLLSEDDLSVDLTAPLFEPLDFTLVCPAELVSAFASLLALALSLSLASEAGPAFASELFELLLAA